MEKKIHENTDKNKKLFDRFLRVSSNTYKNIKVFTEDYIPPRLIHREKLAMHIVDIMAIHQDILLLGLPSAGKTALIKRIFKELSSYDNENAYIYVNCKERHKSDMYHTLIDSLNGESKKRGWSIYQYQITLLETINNLQINLVFICLDEFDSMAKLYDSYEDTLYFFSNTSLFSLIIIANEKESWYHDKIDERTKTRLCFNELNIDSYDIPEIKDILKDRLEKGVNLQKINLSDIELERIAETTFQHTEKLRLGIQVLGDIIDYKLKRFNDGNSELQLWEIKALFKKRDERAKVLYYTNFAPHHRLVLDIICEIKERRMNGDKQIFAIINTITKMWNNNCHKIELTEKTTKTIKTYINYLKEFSIINETKKDNNNVGRKEICYIPNFDIGTWIIEKRKNWSDKSNDDN